MKIQVHAVFDLNTFLRSSFQKKLQKDDVVILPEMFYGGYSIFKNDEEFFIPLENDLINKLKEVSKNKSITLIAGTLPIGKSFKDRKNSSLIFSKGKLISRYDKIHLFKPLNEEKIFLHGKDYSNFNIKINNSTVCFGVIICYDLRFPELTRLKAKKGLKILFVPAWWPKERDEVWTTLLKARAIENQIFVIGINSESEVECGNSYGFAPNGRLLFSTKDRRKKSNYSFTVDTDEISEIKKFIDSFKDAKLLTKILCPEH